MLLARLYYCGFTPGKARNIEALKPLAHYLRSSRDGALQAPLGLAMYRAPVP